MKPGGRTTSNDVWAGYVNEAGVEQLRAGHNLSAENTFLDPQTTGEGGSGSGEVRRGKFQTNPQA